MATTPTVAKAQTATAEAAAQAEEKVQVPGVSRREFLYYAWTASMALLLAESAGMLIWFGLPRFREGEFGGTFPFTGADVPPIGSSPTDIPEGKIWITNSEEGIVALYKVCTHLGCLYKWVDANGRFECPCHGSKYEVDGTYIEGPAPRSLDRFAMTITTTVGETLTTNPTGDPILVDRLNVATVLIDTGTRIKRAGRV
jgi:cytochrome b6-f complex iron-sulfur subunit